jgi:hypothetical protein
MAALADNFTINGDFHTLSVQSGGKVYISQNQERGWTTIKSTEMVKLVNNGGKLEIKGKNSCSGGNSFMSNIFCGNGGGQHVSYGGNSVSISGSTININSGIAPFDFNVTFNGQSAHIVLDSEMGPNGVMRKAPLPDLEHSKEWILMNGIEFKTIAIGGAGAIIFQDAYKLNRTALCMKISGSGDIVIPKITILSVEASISGSGDISFGGSTIQELTASIAGSGDIEDFYVTSKADLSIYGSGDIKGRRSSSCVVDKSNCGSGKISLTL